MPKAIWNDVVIAESDETKMVEGNHYFPPESIKREYFDESNHRTVCPWKGVANYFSLQVNGEVNESAAWTYANPKDAASHIKDHVAFWKGVRVES
jgi:uncharacterized protein (DUF427 family)